MPDIHPQAAAGGNLPTPLSSLIGRQAEIESVAGLLGTARLVSIVGTGGTGKTRLALAGAAFYAQLAKEGSWWADLSSASGRGLVPASVANVLGVAQPLGEDSTTAVIGAVGGSSVLLVLDNCEQVVDECALFVDEVLRACPRLTVLATSREVLGVPGERVFRVGGLGLPGPGDEPSSSEAVQLFLERAAARGGRELGGTELGGVARLCRRVDGLPLAIELAAALVGTLGVNEVAARLEEDLSLLRHPNRTAPRRHQTLEATMEWSYGLLSPGEQALLGALSLFRGTFSLLAVEAVATARGAESKEAVTELGGLVDKSLVQVAERGPEHRYRLLQTVRHYAGTKLSGSPQEAAATMEHSRFFVQLAAQAETGLEGPDQARWLERLDLEHDNLRAVLSRELPAHPEIGGRLAASLWPFWYRRGHYDEARQWLERAAAVAGGTSPEVRAAVLTGAGVLAFLQCDYELAVQRLTEVRALRADQGDRAGLAIVLQRLGSIAREQGGYSEARRLHEESMAIWTELGDAAGAAASEDYLGFVSWLEGSFDEATARSQRALAYFEHGGRWQEAAAARVNLGAAAFHAGDDSSAEAHLGEALALSRRVGYQEGVAWSLHELGALAARRGEPGAAALLAESLHAHAQLGDRWRTASVVETIASALAELKPESATRLLAAAHALRQELGAPVPPAERPEVERAHQKLRASLGEDGFAAAWTVGVEASLPAALELATNELPALSIVGINAPAIAPQVAVVNGGGTASPATSARSTAPVRGPAIAASRAPGADELTQRELEVLVLIGEGLTNREIGRRLYISEGTAGVHVSSILRKLGVTSRVRAAVVARELGLWS